MQATVIRYCGLPVFVACLAVSLATADDTATDAGDAFFEQRIRPLLALLTASMCGYRGPRIIKVAAAGEFLTPLRWYTTMSSTAPKRGADATA